MASNKASDLETVTIKYVDYVVLQSLSPEDEESAGRFNIARAMRERKQTRNLLIVRPNGAKVMSVVQFASGNFSTPVDTFVSLSKGERADMAALAATLRI